MNLGTIDLHSTETTNEALVRIEDSAERIANSLERIANALEHINIENIEHNHVETDAPVEVNTHAKTW